MKPNERFIFDQSIIKIRPIISEEDRDEFEKAYNAFNTPVLLQFIKTYLPDGIIKAEIPNIIIKSEIIPNNHIEVKAADDKLIQQNIYQLKSLLHHDFKRLHEIILASNQPSSHYFHQLIIEMTANENPNQIKVIKLIGACLIKKHEETPLTTWIDEFTLLLKEKIEGDRYEFKYSVEDKLKHFQSTSDENQK